VSLVDLDDLVGQEVLVDLVDLEPTLEYLVQVHPVKVPEVPEDLGDHLKAMQL